jgi:carotenoid cleavage dioxygenase-like enzyme
MTAPTHPVDSPFLQGNYGPVREEVTAESLSVVGELPRGLEGMFVRNGPNPQFPPIRGYHWFGGDGMLHGVRIQGGKASYRNRWVRTEAFLKERAAQRALWPSDMGPPDLENPEGPRRGNTANTALVFHDGRLLALWEGGDPYHVRAPDLETVGPHNFEGKLSHAFTAHPKVDPVTGELLFFGYSLYGEPFLQYSVASREGRIVHTTPIELPIGVMMHDFAVTERYAVFLDLPYTFSMEKAERGENPFAWEPERGARFGVLPRHADGSQIKWFSGPACYVFHTVNAFEDGDEVVLDACRMGHLDLFGLKTDFATEDATARLHRWRFNMKTGALKERPLDDVKSDFPRINERLTGRSARFAYAARFGAPNAYADGFIKYDLTTGKSEHHEHGPSRSGGEGVFVPRPDASAEDDGWLMTYVHDDSSGKSELVILDAQNISARPVARVLLPQRVPHGFHGAWLSSEQIASQRP